MTIEELIKELEKYPKDTRVYDECLDEVKEIIQVVSYDSEEKGIMLKTYYGNSCNESWED